jgi:beta-lactam-binding protein with PASTA domain
MAKESLLKKLFANKIFTNVLIMIVIFTVLIVLTLIGLNLYTRHNQSLTVPNVKGLQVNEAASFLSTAGLKYEVVDSVYRRGGTPGAIIEQVPKASSQIKVGRTVFLTVQAFSQQMISVPDLTDYSQRQAVSLLEALGFTNIQIDEVYSEYKDLVISVEYNNKPLRKGQKVPIDAFVRMQVGNGIVEPVPDSTTTSEPETKGDKSDESFF